MKGNKKRIALDAALTVMIVFEMFIQFTGEFLHEVVGFAFFACLVVHVALSAKWTKGTVRLARDGRLKSRRAALAVMGCLLAVVALVLGVSSVAISGILADAGFTWPFGSYALWASVHSISAYAFCALVVVHLAMHWAYMATSFKVPYDPSRRKAIGAGVSAVAAFGVVALGVSAAKAQMPQVADALEMASGSADAGGSGTGGGASGAGGSGSTGGGAAGGGASGSAGNGSSGSGLSDGSANPSSGTNGSGQTSSSSGPSAGSMGEGRGRFHGKHSGRAGGGETPYANGSSGGAGTADAGNTADAGGAADAVDSTGSTGTNGSAGATDSTGSAGPAGATNANDSSQLPNSSAGEPSGGDSAGTSATGVCTLCRKRCSLSNPKCDKPYEAGLL